MHMARRPTYAELQDRVSEMEAENQSLNDKLDSISDIVGKGSANGCRWFVIAPEISSANCCQMASMSLTGRYRMTN
jgi:hypothetical protein